MNRSAVVAWIIAAVCAVAAVVDLAIRPIHWDRTLAVAVVIGIVAVFYAVRKGGATPRLQA
jgi:hypothetical protein